MVGGSVGWARVHRAHRFSGRSAAGFFYIFSKVPSSLLRTVWASEETTSLEPGTGTRTGPDAEAWVTPDAKHGWNQMPSMDGIRC